VSDISAFGISATLPAGWDGRIFRRAVVTPEAAAAPQSRSAASATTEPTSPEGGTVHPVAHLASFPLPAVRGDYGSGAVELMGTMDVLVCLLEFDPTSTGTALFARHGIPRFRAREFAPGTMQRTIAGMCGAQAFFSESGRAFSAYVVLGSYPLRDTLAPAVNVLLGSVQIDPQ
jgi:hypothetical protein